MKSKKVLPCPPAGAGANVDFHDGDERSVEDWEDEELVKLSNKILKFKFFVPGIYYGGWKFLQTIKYK